MAMIKFAKQSEMPADNEAKEFAAGDATICVVRVGGELCAIDNVCLHRGGPLGQGTVENGKVVCPWHAWQWDPKTGQAVHNVAAKVAVYRLEVQGEDVMVELP